MAIAQTSTLMSDPMPAGNVDVLGAVKQSGLWRLVQFVVSGGAGGAVAARTLGFAAIYTAFQAAGDTTALAAGSVVAASITLPNTNGTYNLLVFGEGVKESVSNVGTLNG